MIGSGRPARSEAPPFGRHLAAERIARGWSQAELADRLGISQKMVEYYERRATNPSVGFVQKAADLFGLTVAEMLGEEPKRKRARAKPGPPPQLVDRFERIQRLPRRDREIVLRFIDTYLDGAEKTG